MTGHETKTLDIEGTGHYNSIEKRADSAPVIESSKHEYSARRVEGFTDSEVINFIQVMNRFISIGGLPMKDILDVHGETMKKQQRIKFMHAVKNTNSERMVNIVRDIFYIFENNGIEDVKGVYSQLTSWAFGTIACNLPYSIKHNNGDIVPFPTTATEKELKMLLEMILY
uniref:NR LBD domain-containing protein n=1 Tax=Meloidogyne hapla TaxID=6305 RepID=A0A1I8BTZ9_MELHA